ncbi:MAG: hypothetical protein K2H37_12245 [Lachnospiraceae bacterium]|nr:hypothetical protein [Lachnospiraceae bacterium]
MRGKMGSCGKTVRRVAGGLAGLFFALCVCGQAGSWDAASVAYAEEKDSVSENEIKYVERSSDRVITDDDRFDADEDLLYYMQSLEVRYHLDEKVMEGLHKLFDSAVYYIANTEMSLTELWSYVSSVKGNMESAAIAKVTQTTSEFLQVGDNWQTPVVSYGQGVSIVLPIVNFGTEELNDLIVEPVISTLVTEWPFEPDTTNYLQTEPFIPGCQTKEAAMANRREFTFHFKTRSDVMTGYYPLKFKISYTKAGIRSEEPAELTVYVKTVGKPGSGIIGGNGQEAAGSKPRIVVTGFETNPAKVFAGETFTLMIHVKNTSRDTAVTNVLFDMQAAQEGEDKTNTYSAFLPTSGSSSVYMEQIAPNTSADIEIEMTAKADLAQKPYVLDVNMKYDAGMVFDLTDKASVSIPILQESRFDTSIPEVVPDSIEVGSQSNVMFSIYNTGKTTLYNVQVKFIADSIAEASAFVGNLQSGNTGNVDVMLTGAAPTMDDGIVKLEISYEDDAGNVTTEEKEITLFVNEVMMDDMMMGDDMMGGDMMMEGEEGGKPKTGLIVVGVSGAVVLAAAGLGVFLKLRKRKRAAAAEAAELAELEKDLFR